MSKVRRLQFPAWLTITQAAEYLGLHYHQCYKLVREGRLPILPDVRPYRIDRDALHRWARIGK